jgi:hypothetical protein
MTLEEYGEESDGRRLELDVEVSLILRPARDRHLIAAGPRVNRLK